MSSSPSGTHDVKAPPVTALLLVGGASRRMKQNKAFLPLGQETLIQHLLKALDSIMSEIIICCAAPEPYRFLGRRMALDRFKGEGPMVAIEAGLKLSRTDLNFIMACDIPDIDRDLWQQLLLRALSCDIAVPQHPNGFYDPLFAFYHRRTLPLISSLLDQGERQILQVYPLCHTEALPLREGYKLWNLNTPEEYRTYLGLKNI